MQETPLFADKVKAGTCRRSRNGFPDRPGCSGTSHSWEKPNPYFIESQARAAPLFLFRPAHYLRKFHARYADPSRISPTAQGGQPGGNWVQTFRRLDVMFGNDNVDLPSLNPWINTTPSPAQRFVFVQPDTFWLSP